MFFVVLWTLGTREFLHSKLVRNAALDGVQADTVTQLNQVPSYPTSIEASSDANVVGMTQEGETPNFHHAVFCDDIFKSGNTEFIPNTAFSSYTDSLVHYMSSHPSAKIKVVSHSNAQESVAGGHEYISIKRAEAVVAYLADRGVNADKMSFKGKGEAEPRIQGDHQDAMKKNRRIEIIVE
jgi:outer membrane protein OmpA-like peptidoglycan-associated protein